MKINAFGEVGRTESELTDAFRSDPTIPFQKVYHIDPTKHNKAIADTYEELDAIQQWSETELDLGWHQKNQQNWRMPESFAEIDIAQLLLSRCSNDAELQRMGEELIMFQERDLFPMLNYLHYLVTTLREHQVVLGVGRGSSVASFALYKLGVHRVNSLYYSLDIKEFLK